MENGGALEEQGGMGKEQSVYRQATPIIYVMETSNTTSTIKKEALPIENGCN